MKRFALFVAFVAVLVAAVVMAAPNADPIHNNENQYRWIYPQFFNQAVTVSFVDAGNLKVNGVSLTPTGRGTLIYDFPSIPSLGAGSACQDSAAGTATGCAFGDAVLLGIDQTLPANRNAAPPVAYVSAANAFTVRVCNDSTDAGAIDWPDASYTVTCIR